MFRRSIVLSVLLGFAIVPVWARSPVEEEASHIVDLFYDLQFNKAVAAAKLLEKNYPDYPAGYFYESVAYYQLHLLEDPPKPKTFNQFLELSQTAESKAKRMVASPALSHYYQGAALGFQARAYVSLKKYALAIPRAREGAAQLKQAIQLDPTLEDANLGLGMYYYFLSRVPIAVKPFAYLMIGMKGDREKGRALLTYTAVAGDAARMEAKSILASIDASENKQRWDAAQKLFMELMEAYPHNPRYRLKLSYVLQRKGLWEQANAVLDDEGGWAGQLDPFVRVRAQQVVTYRTAENLLFEGHYAEAGRALDRLEALNPSGFLKEWTELRRANYWDAVSQPQKARVFYEKIKNKKAHALAETYEKSPFPQGSRDVMPGRWPLSTIPE